MASRSSALMILLQLFMILKLCNCQFETDYLAKYVNVSDDEYENRSKCWTKVCMQDSGRLIYSADHDSVKSHPCDDFPTFAMGEFLKHRVPSERYAKLGFRAEIEAQFFEKQKKILNEPVKLDEPKIFKVVKSFFKKCINSANIITNGPADMLSYMKKLNLPIALGEDWDEENFEIQRLFNFDPELTFDLFYDLKLRWCKDRLCGDMITTWKYDSNIHEDSLNIMKTLKVDDKLTQAAVADFTTFLEGKLPQQISSLNFVGALYYDASAYVEKFNFPKQNWKRTIEDYLVHLGGDPSKAFVHCAFDYKRWWHHHAISKIFEKLSKRFIANVFSVAFARKYQKAFIVYSFTKQEEKIYGTKRSYQRFEQCVQFLESNMRLAFDALLAEKLFDKSVQAAATEMAREVIEDVLLHSEKSEWFNEAQELKARKLSVMFSNDVTNVTRIVDSYKDLKLDGSESLVKMFIEIAIFNKRLTDREQEPDKNHENTISIPVELTLYPSFHPERPRFFNTAFFYREVLRIVGGQIYVSRSLPIDLAYKHYVNWLDKGNQDLHLPAFKMTSRQMFWLSVTHVMTEKYQIGVSKTFELAHQLTNKYMHVILKNKTEFRDDFKCGEMTSKETKLFEEFQKKMFYLSKAISLQYLSHVNAVWRFIDFKQSGMFEFIESVLTDPLYTADLKVMKDAFKTDQWNYDNAKKIFSWVCPSREGCQEWL